MRTKLTAIAAASALAATAAPAAAQSEPGLTVDPQSPAGVEYAVPLDQGRGHGDTHPGGGGGGSGTSSNGGSGSPELFGSGITPGGKDGSASRGGGGGSKEDTGGSGKDDGSAGSGSSSGSARHSVAPVAASAEYSTTAPIAGVIGGVLLVGGGLGVFLRLRRRPGTD